MVVGLFIVLAIPTVTGVSQAFSAQTQAEERAKEAKRMKKFHIDVHCDTKSPRMKEVHGHRLILKNERVWIGPVDAVNPHPQGYVAEGFYIEYPDNEVSLFSVYATDILITLSSSGIPWNLVLPAK
jgi:hypothetical protein